MRKIPCAVTILFYLYLLPSSATAEIAIGFSLFRETGPSLWRVNPRSMIGAEIGLGFMQGSSNNTKRVRSALTVIQIYRSDELAPLSYQRASAIIERIEVNKRRSWDAEGEIGIGFIWRPPKKNISLSLQQGVSLSYRKWEETRESEETIEKVTEVVFSRKKRSFWLGQIRPTRLLATFSF